FRRALRHGAILPYVWGTLNQSRSCYVTFRLDPGASVKKVRNCIGAADRGKYRRSLRLWCPFEPEVRNRFCSTMRANFGFGALVEVVTDATPPPALAASAAPRAPSLPID